MGRRGQDIGVAVVRARASRGFDRILLSSSVSPRRPYCNGTVPLQNITGLVAALYILIFIGLLTLYTTKLMGLAAALYINICRSAYFLKLKVLVKYLKSLLEYLPSIFI